MRRADSTLLRLRGFDDDTALRPGADGAYEGAIADGWWTPRGPLGGYVQAIVLRAMQLAVGDDERRPRSMTMHFLRVPEVGPVLVRPVVERAGRSLTSVSARLEQNGRLLGLAWVRSPARGRAHCSTTRPCPRWPRPRRAPRRAMRWATGARRSPTG
jgi:hypothetical protein